MLDKVRGWTPNPTLMQVSQYYKGQNKVVNLITNFSGLKAYRHIYVFKNFDKNTKVDRSLILSPDNTTYIGSYYYNKEKKKEDYKIKCDYEIYEIAAPSDMLDKCKYFKQMKNNSIINIEDNDYSNFNPDKSKIFFSDIDLFKDNAADILDRYISNYQLYFLYPQVIQSKEQFNKFFKYYQYCNFIHYNILSFNEAFTFDFINTYKDYKFLFKYRIKTQKDIDNLIYLGSKIKMNQMYLKFTIQIDDSLSNYAAILKKYASWIFNKDKKCFIEDYKLNNLNKLFDAKNLKYLTHKYT